MDLLSTALALLCVPMLEMRPESGAPLQLPLAADARFSVTYWHSMYDAPVTETFVVGDDEIRLTTVRTSNPRVLEYLEIEGPVDTDIAVERHFPAIPFRVAMRQAQTLTTGARNWSFREFGESGARLVLLPAKHCATDAAPAKPNG